MKIYTTSGGGASLNYYRQYDVGCMIPSPCKSNLASIRKNCDFFALDNGAFGCYRRGLPFMREYFMDTIKKTFDAGITLDFLTCPDILCAGMESLEWSLEWATGELRGVRNLALVVQPGMTPKKICHYLRPFSWIFVGGDNPWKWDTLNQWVTSARDWGMKIHVGQVGTAERLVRCDELGVDSVDSSSYMRNKSWRIIEEFRNCKQPTLFGDINEQR